MMGGGGVFTLSQLIFRLFWGFFVFYTIYFTHQIQYNYPKNHSELIIELNNIVTMII